MREVLSGIGVCEGVVKGKVKIIKNITKLPGIEENSILVMPFFTPIISMAVSKARGIIADFGGKTSHAAVIAREFNIPCVVGVNNGSELLKNGQEVILDGKRGVVYEF